MAWAGTRRFGPRSKALLSVRFLRAIRRGTPPGSTSENEFGSAPLWWSSPPRPTARNSANCTTFRCRRDPKCRTVHPNGRAARRIGAAWPCLPRTRSKTFGRNWVPFRQGGACGSGQGLGLNGFLPHVGSAPAVTFNVIPTGTGQESVRISPGVATFPALRCAGPSAGMSFFGSLVTWPAHSAQRVTFTQRRRRRFRTRALFASETGTPTGPRASRESARSRVRSAPVAFLWAGRTSRK